MFELKYKGRGDLKEYTYHLEETTTGQDFLDLRRVSTMGPFTDMAAYNHLNVMKRLKQWDRPEELNEVNVLALGRDIYHVLYNQALRMDSEELEEANSFLAASLTPLQQRELASITAALSKDGQPPSAQSSDTESSDTTT